MFWTIILLICSNVFMAYAWYEHLKHKEVALWLMILASWGIAFVEYCFQVPANRIGSNAGMSPYKLKTIQEVIALSVFIVYVWFSHNEPLKWNYLVGFVLICAGAVFVFAPWAEHAPKSGDTLPRVVVPVDASAK